jgi:hypothetical protein
MQAISRLKNKKPSVRALEPAPLVYAGPAALADVAVVYLLPFRAFYAGIAYPAGAVIAFCELRGLVAASSARFYGH